MSGGGKHGDGEEDGGAGKHGNGDQGDKSTAMATREAGLASTAAAKWGRQDEKTKPAKRMTLPVEGEWVRARAVFANARRKQTVAAAMTEATATPAEPTARTL